VHDRAPLGFLSIQAQPNDKPSPVHNGSLTPTAARRLLYAIVGACVALTGAVALLRPAPPPAVGPQTPVTIVPRLPFAVPAQYLGQGVVVVPIRGLEAPAVRLDTGVPSVHGLPGQVGAAP